MRKTIVRLNVSRDQVDAIEADRQELKIFIDRRSNRSWGICDKCQKYYVFGNPDTNDCDACEA